MLIDSDFRKASPTDEEQELIATELPGLLSRAHQQKWELCVSIARYRARWPHLVGSDIAFDIQQLFCASDRAFFEARQEQYIQRLILSLYRVRLQAAKLMQFEPDIPQVACRLVPGNLHFRFGQQPVLSIALAVSLGHPHAQLDVEYLKQKIPTLLSGARLVERTFLTYRKPRQPLMVVLFELVRENCALISSAEKRHLQTILPGVVSAGIASVQAPLFCPRNQEEVLRSIVTLSRQLEKPSDCPQITISFEQQNQQELKFCAVLTLYERQTGTKTATLLEQLDDGMRLTVDEQHLLERSYSMQKIALVMTVWIASRPFQRADAAIDLYRLRQHLISRFARCLGPIRDYNGGLLQLQGEALIKVKQLLNLSSQVELFELENFFFSLTPAESTCLLPPNVIARFYRLMQAGGELNKPIQMRFEGYELITLRLDDPTACRHVQETVRQGSYGQNKPFSAKLVTRGSHLLGYVIATGDEQDGPSPLHRTIQQALSCCTQGQRHSQCLRTAVLHTNPSLDPRVSADRRTGAILKMLYEGLMRLNAQGNVEPAIAHKVEISGDGKRYRFLLRKSYWSDGTRLVADDFAYAWKRIIEPSSKTCRSRAFHPINQVPAVKQGLLPMSDVGIHVEADDVLIVELGCPNPHFLAYTTHWQYSPVRRELDDHHPSWAYLPEQHHLCNGPFYVKSMTPDREIILAKNHRYWNSDVGLLDEIRISLVNQPQSALALFKQGKLDWLGGPLCNLALTSREQDDRIKLLPSQAEGYYYWPNTQSKPFNSTNFRKALSYAIDRKTISSEVLGYRAQPAYNFIPPQLMSNREDFKKECSVSNAQQYLAKALQELGQAVEDLSPIRIHHLPFADDRLVANEIARQWKQVLGLQTRLIETNLESYEDLQSKRDFDVVGINWYGFVDPYWMLQTFYAADQIRNPSGWSNSDFDDKIRAILSANSATERHQTICGAERMLLNEMPALPLYFPKNYGACSPAVRGVIASPFFHLDFSKARMVDQPEEVPDETFAPIN